MGRYIENYLWRLVLEDDLRRMKREKKQNPILRTVCLNRHRMKVNIEKAIELARNNKSLEGVTIEDLKDTQVKAVDALLLAENSIVIPEQNIFYDDSDIAYDPDFDDVEWSEEPVRLTWEEKADLARQISED